MYLYISIYIL